MKKLLLASLCLAVGLARVPAMAADSAADATASAANRFWAEAEYLRWTVKGDKLPALVTTSPPGTPPAQRGVLGFPGTAVLFGDSTVNDGWRSGGRAGAGFWFDDRRTSGIETSVFQLGDAATNFRASSDGNSILARPFLDATTTRQDALLIASPGLLSGQITANETSHFLGAGLLYRREICACRVVDRISGLLGYRFLRATDRLSISTEQVSVNSPAFTIAATDRFETTNNFHGLDLGLAGELLRGHWRLEWLTRVALGANVSDARIKGVSTIDGMSSAGGLLALPTNIGHVRENHFAVVPDVSAKIGYQVAPSIRIHAGYSFLYWTNVIRPGGGHRYVRQPNPAAPRDARRTGPSATPVQSLRPVGPRHQSRTGVQFLSASGNLWPRRCRWPIFRQTVYPRLTNGRNGCQKTVSPPFTQRSPMDLS